MRSSQLWERGSEKVAFVLLLSSLPQFLAAQAHWSSGSSLCFFMPLHFCTCSSLSLQSFILQWRNSCSWFKTWLQCPLLCETSLMSPWQRHWARWAPPAHTQSSNKHAVFTFSMLPPHPPKKHFTLKSSVHTQTHTRCKSFPNTDLPCYLLC